MKRKKNAASNDTRILELRGLFVFVNRLFINCQEKKGKRSKLRVSSTILFIVRCSRGWSVTGQRCTQTRCREDLASANGERKCTSSSPFFADLCSRIILRVVISKQRTRGQLNSHVNTCACVFINSHRSGKQRSKNVNRGLTIFRCLKRDIRINIEN